MASRVFIFYIHRKKKKKKTEKIIQYTENVQCERTCNCLFACTSSSSLRACLSVPSMGSRIPLI